MTIDEVALGCEMVARDVATKFSKTFSTWFFPVGGEALAIVTDWIDHLRGALLRGDGDALFPATKMGVGPDGGFAPAGLERHGWSTAEPVRRIFRAAFAGADLPYFHPHSLRDTLTQLGERVCRTPEQFKAWSQNLGHESVLTTLSSYGAVAAHRQAELIRGLGVARPAASVLDDPNVLALISAIQATSNGGSPGAGAGR